ncbi:hypothetical protein M3Y97_00294400 [Aphelenchoides bicaudatus]|nr:hypothetical protein M3Y97_00294400 [Aphelenchoides bicaudatus]
MILLVFLLLLPVQVFSSIDDDLILVGSNVCNSYNTLERQFKCGQSGYFIGYGLRYCNRFFNKDYYSHFDNTGKHFVNCTGPCLIDELKSFLKTTPKAGCQAITNKAFGTHVDCYVKCGFCKACKTNKDALRRIYEFKDFLSTKALETVEDTLKKCGGIISGALGCLFG